MDGQNPRNKHRRAGGPARGGDRGGARGGPLRGGRQQFVGVRRQNSDESIGERIFTNQSMDVNWRKSNRGREHAARGGDSRGCNRGGPNPRDRGGSGDYDRAGAQGQSREGSTNQEAGRKPRYVPRLTFTLLKQLIENEDPNEILEKFRHPEQGLRKLFSDPESSVELFELALVALGIFCERNGATLYHNGFILMVQCLGEADIFHQIANIIMQIPFSRSLNLPPKEERLKRLLKSIYLVTSDVLTVLPAFACNFLGENFFVDIIALKSIPSIHNLGCGSSFDLLNQGIPRMEIAWEQNTRVVAATTERGEQRRREEAARNELFGLQQPPDDYRQLSVLPKWEDICIDMEPFLRPNIVKGSYPDVDTYLDVQFRLLREDFNYPLRDGLVKFRKIGPQNGKRRQTKVENVRFYYDVKILDYVSPQKRLNDTDSRKFILQFPTKGLGRINWEGSKRFMNSSLLCISSDNFATFHLFTVVLREASMLAEGKIVVSLEGDEPLKANAKRNVYIMAETPAYFEAYRSNLLALQRISPTHFPMEEYILGKGFEPVLPAYLAKLETGAIYDLTSLRSSFHLDPADNIHMDDYYQRPPMISSLALRDLLTKVNIRDPDNRPGPFYLGLDPSQSEALYAALTEKLVVIQGPPGTGKTFLGLKIVEILIRNKSYWSALGKPVPILVICYTNHALDQFMEGIMRFTKNIVRIGGQSKCEALKPYSLIEWKRRTGNQPNRASQHRRMYYQLRDELSNKKRELDARRNVMGVVESSSIIHEDTLYELKVIPKHLYDKICAFRKESKQSKNTHGSILPYWLGVGDDNQLSRVIKEFRTTKVEEAMDNLELDNEQPVGEDDEWDKDDIDAILAQRMVETDDNYDDDEPVEVEAGAKKQKTQKKNLNTTIEFALQFSEIMEEIESHEEMLQEGEEDLDTDVCEAKIKSMNRQLQLLKQLMSLVLPVNDEGFLVHLYAENLARIPHTQRWMMYTYWKNLVVDHLDGDVTGLEVEYRFKVEELKDVETLESAEICRSAEIIGITTTGAAKQRALLEHLNSKIIVVEEAAEVLEAHITTALSASCQHLILIGDHQQLRPTTTVYHLAKKYHLDVSLFERLILNGMKPRVLQVQHRMRPEVARLIVPSIYPVLKNDPSVLKYPHIKGILQDVFFLAHNKLEKGDSEVMSHLNPYEVDLSLALARHFLMQGYDPSRITILTTYSGQLLHFRKIRRNHSVLAPVRISVVDNFQGEENDIIILSLVRSNEEKKIGFLSTENRICVALSRAKEGFYLIGNMDALQGKSKLWTEISSTLKIHKQLGAKFGLKCELHGTIMEANEPKDFPPEGGCFLKCLTEMPCGHICPKICHASDREHALTKCTEQCTRSCSFDHPCPKMCYKDCNPCLTRVPKLLPCGHSQICECHSDPKDEFCRTIVTKVFPVCQHSADVQCGKPLKEVKCIELCGMSLDCHHFCNRVCHDKTSHENFVCRQKCSRSCPENHPCPKECHEPCGNCLVQVVKKLPCGHDRNLRCHILPLNAYCTEKVRKTLSKCQHTAILDCSEPTVDYVCTRPCDRIVCGDGHPCKKKCHEPCGVCSVYVERELRCGHKNNMKCHVDPQTFKCLFPKEVVMPGCGHKTQIACWSDPDQAQCPVPCDIRLDCGHACTQRCHVRNDPHHEKYICTKVCDKNKMNCKKEHKCGKKCHETCDPCYVKWKRHLPCGHSRFIECHWNDEDIFCSEIMSKIVPDCGHKIKGPCSQTMTRADCKEMCSKILRCGHRCKKKCCETCDPSSCEEVVTLNDEFGLCGHKLAKPCVDNQLKVVTQQHAKEKYLAYCTKPCVANLEPCKHQCQGSCGECFNGRLHKACQEKCGRPLVCGHLCDVNCAATCPPCQKSCESRCQHSRCANKCSDPCARCIEPCGWNCEHYSCSVKCWQFCDRPRCDEPCKKILNCDHPCAGLCGEKCPPLCRICDREELTEFVLLGNETDDDARFVYLTDCGHSIEVEGLDHWMDMKNEGSEIQMKGCPRCKTIIRECFRYGNTIKHNLIDIISVKQKILGSRGKSSEFAESLLAKIAKPLSSIRKLESEVTHQILTLMMKSLMAITISLTPKKKNNNSVYLNFDTDQQFLMKVKVDVVDRILDLIEKSLPEASPAARFMQQTRPSMSLTPELRTDLLNKLQRVFQSLDQRRQISNEEFQDLLKEVERLKYLRGFFQLKSFPNYTNNTAIAHDKKKMEDLLVYNVKKLTNIDLTSLKVIFDQVGRMLGTGLGIDDVEREQIVKALGMTQGHWFKCPNGHPYVITECGGAMQEGTCNECGAKIGGGSHRLRSDNRLAGEMDGARHAAWSEQNNMANFVFDL